MRIWARLRSLFRYTFQKRSVEADLNEELRGYVDTLIARKTAAGIPAEDARRSVLAEMGGVEQVKEQVRDYQYGAFLNDIGRDARYAIRTFARNRTFVFVVVVTLALGIGANTAIFTLMDALSFKSLPVRDPQRLAELRSGTRQSFSRPVWQYIRENDRFFDGIVAYGTSPFNLAASGETRIVNGQYVSGSFFQMLGVNPIAGRLIEPDDDTPGCSANGPVAVLGYGFWQSEYGGSVTAIGQSIAVAGQPYTIIGVTPPAFYGLRIGQSFDVALPVCARTGPGIDSPSVSWLRIVGRLKPNEPITEAESGLRTLQPALREMSVSGGGTFKEYLKVPFELLPAAAGSSGLRTQYSQSLVILMGLVGMVLLVACGNIAGLLMARASARTRELAVRASIGASRYRLVRQLLVESIILSIAGAIGGIVLARGATKLLIHQLDTSRTRVVLDLSLDWRVLLFTATAGVLTGVLFGIIPALRATRWKANETLHEITTGARASKSSHAAGRWLIAFQIGLSLVLVFGAVLFLRSYWILSTGDHGFRASHVLLVNAVLRQASPGTRIDSKDAAPFFQTYVQGLEAIRALPGVESAALSDTVPLGDVAEGGRIRVDGLERQTDSGNEVYLNDVGPRYFATLRTAFIVGRDFTSAESAQKHSIAIVNETFVRKFFGHGFPIGKVFHRATGLNTWEDVEIVGIVEDASYNELRDTVPPTIYLPISPVEVAYGTVFSIRTTDTSASIGAQIVKTLLAVSPNFSLTVQPLQAKVDDSVARERLLAILSIFFGVLALVIAAVGLAGLVAYSVDRRRAEIGIRSALGATPSALIGLLMGELRLPVVCGVVAGTVLCLALGRLVSALLYRIMPDDPFTLGLSAATLIAVALLAAYIPARRVAKIDPMACLRSE